MELSVIMKVIGYIAKNARIRGHRRMSEFLADRIYQVLTEPTLLAVVDEDYSMYRDGKPTRFLPDAMGARLCRVRPPYWNMYDRTTCA